MVTLNESIKTAEHLLDLYYKMQNNTMIRASCYTNEYLASKIREQIEYIQSLKNDR